MQSAKAQTYYSAETMDNAEPVSPIQWQSLQAMSVRSAKRQASTRRMFKRSFAWVGVWDEQTNSVRAIGYTGIGTKNGDKVWIDFEPSLDSVFESASDRA